MAYFPIANTSLYHLLFCPRHLFFLLNLCILAYRWPLGRRPRKRESSSFGLMSGAIATFLAACQFLGRCSTACMGRPSLTVSIKGEDKTFSCSESIPVHTSTSFGLISEAIATLAASQFLGRCSTACMEKPSFNVSIMGEDTTFSCSGSIPVPTHITFALKCDDMFIFWAVSQFLGRCSTACSVKVFCSEYMIETIPV